MLTDQIDKLATSHDFAQSLGQPGLVESAANFSPHDATILIIDDEPINLELAEIYLMEDGYHSVLTTADSRQALPMIREHRPDCILLDLMMPHVSGFEVLHQVRHDAALSDTPIVILTASNSTDSRLRALEMGVNDFLSKPVDSSELLLRLRNTLAAKTLRDHLADYSSRLEREVQRRTVELEVARLEALNCLARAGEYRDDDTGEHVLRVGRYAGIIAHGLGFDRQRVELLEQSAQLHDVGKIGIPDAILLKPGRLDADEFDKMREHCRFGRAILRPMSDEEWQHVRDRLPWGHLVEALPVSPIMNLAAIIAETHHERWDGNGYPHGLSGEQIPIEGRIAAVADVFDAVSSKRPYKEPMSWDASLNIIREGRGAHFDPIVVDVFFAHLNEVRSVYLEFSDHSERDAEARKDAMRLQSR